MSRAWARWPMPSTINPVASTRPQTQVAPNTLRPLSASVGIITAPASKAPSDSALPMKAVATCQWFQNGRALMR